MNTKYKDSRNKVPSMSNTFPELDATDRKPVARLGVNEVRRSIYFHPVRPEMPYDKFLRERSGE